MPAPTTVADAQRDDPALTAADLISAYEQGVEELRLAVAGMTVEQLRSRPVAGKWSTLEVVCHVADCEQFFADRLKRTVAMDRPLLLGADGFRYPEPLRYQEHDLERRTRPRGRHPATNGPHAQARCLRRLAAHRRPQRNRPGDAAATAPARHQPPASPPAFRGREAGGDDSALSAARSNHRTYRPAHGRRRLPTEPLLRPPHPRVAEPCQEMSRPGEGQDVVPHAVVFPVPLDQETLLPAPRMVRQRAVGEAEPLHRPVLVHHDYDAAGVEPPQADGPGQDRHHLPFLDRRVLWTRLQPAEAELLPALQGGFGGGEDLLALTQP